MTLPGFVRRAEELQWLYAIARMASPMLSLSTYGIARSLATIAHDPSAERLWQRARMGHEIAMAEIPSRFLPFEPDVCRAGDHAPRSRSLVAMAEFGQEMNRGPLPEIIFVSLVFAFEAEIGRLDGHRSPELRECFERRHVYAHRGGVADERYVRALSNSSLRHTIGAVAVGDRINTSHGALVASIEVLFSEAEESLGPPDSVGEPV